MKTTRVTLGEIAEIRAGVGFPTRLQGRQVGRYPFAKVGDISIAARLGEPLSRARNYVDEDLLQELGAKPFPTDSIVFAKIGEAIGQNFRVLTSRDVLLDNNAMGIICDIKQVVPAFLLHYLRTVDFYPLAGKTSVPAIRKSSIEALSVPLPTIQVQNKVAAILDRADSIRRKRKETIALTDQLLRSTFLEMFGDPVTNLMGWPRKSLREIALVTGGLQVTGKRSGLPIEVPYLRVANVYRDELSLGELKVLRVTNQELGRAQLTAGDILIVEGHGNADEIGRAALWDGSVTPCVHQNHLIRVSVNRQATDPVYLNAFINSAAGRRHMQRMGKTTSGLNTISTENVRSMEVLLPPLELQLRFASFIASARSFLQKQRSVLACAEDLFNSLVQRAFTGQL